MNYWKDKEKAILVMIVLLFLFLILGIFIGRFSAHNMYFLG